MNLRGHIGELRAAISRSDDELQRMRVALGPDQCPCCVGAAYGGTGGPYDTLERKRDRQEAWLRVLMAKVAGDVGLDAASEAYADIVARTSRADGRRR